MIRKFTIGIITATTLALAALPLEAKEQIIYSHITDGYWQIWTMDTDGRHQRQITFSASDKREPEWLGDGIIFSTNNGQLVSVDFKTGKEQEMLAGFENVHSPRYSPFIRKLTYVSLSLPPAEIGQIWVADLDGKNARLLTQDKRFKYQPSFSTRGDKIIFVKAAQDRNTHNIWMMDVDGTNAKQLTFFSERDKDPDLSRDERSLVFSSNNENHDYDLYILDFQSGKVEKLFESPGGDISPRFSSDGKRVAFVSMQSGSQQIWSVALDRTGLKQLTNAPGESVDPVWVDIADER